MTASPVGESGASLLPSPGNTSAPEAVVNATAVSAGPYDFLRVPEKVSLVDAEFVRQGPDILLIGADGVQFLVRDYFGSFVTSGFVHAWGRGSARGFGSHARGSLGTGSIRTARAGDDLRAHRPRRDA